jgi:hypothetical protein
LAGIFYPQNFGNFEKTGLFQQPRDVSPTIRQSTAGRTGKAEQDALLAQDEALRKKGALMGAVEPKVTMVRAWDGSVGIAAEPFSELKAPLASFSIIDADSLGEVINMVAKTPCARAGGAIEVRPIMMMNEEQWKLR